MAGAIDLDPGFDARMIKELDLEERFRCIADVVRYRDKMNRFLKRRMDQEAVYA